jgi:hypothetical protein
VSEPCHLVIKGEARRALEYRLAPSTAFAVWEFIAGPLVEDPQNSAARTDACSAFNRTAAAGPDRGPLATETPLQTKM